MEDMNQNVNGTETCTTNNCLNNFTPFVDDNGETYCVTCGMGD